MFKILADECIHKDLIAAIKKRHFDIISVKEAGLTGGADETIFLKTKHKILLNSYFGSL